MIAHLALLLWFVPAPVDPTPRLRVREGSARLASARQVRTLDRQSGELVVESPSAYVECAAKSGLELTWRGLASVELSGPAAFEFGAQPGLVLENFRTAELEVRRGHFQVEVSGVAVFELAGGAAQLVSSPSGLEVLNRGAATFVLHTLEGEEVPVASGRRVRVARHD